MRAHETARPADRTTSGRVPARTRAPAGAGTAAGATSPQALLALQGTAGNAAVVQLLRQAGRPQAQEQHQHGAGCGHQHTEQPQVQRVPADESRSRRQAAINSPFSHTPRSERLQQQGGYTRGQDREPPVPVQDDQGRALWNGTRRNLNFREEDITATLRRTSSQTNASGAQTYACASCGTFLPQQRDAGPRQPHVQVDHINPILRYVYENTDTQRWSVGNRTAEGMLLADAQAAARDQRNLRVLCNSCNAGRNSTVSSRDMDTSNPTRWIRPNMYG